MSNKQLDQEYKNMMNAAAKMAFITAVRRNGESTLADVASMAQKEGLGDLTIGETFFEKVDFGTAKKALTAPKKSKSKKMDAPAVNTRTPNDRKAYDTKLLEMLQGTRRWTSAQELRQRVGGTPLQARKALNRLIEQELVKYQGQARATKYRVRKKKTA